jgi:hypothetical protein
MRMKTRWRNILIIVGVILAVFLLIDFNRRMEGLNRMTAKLDSVRAEGTNIMATRDALVTQVAYATSDDAVEQWAYRNGWAREGEHPVQLVPEGGATATPEPPPPVPTQSAQPWQVWWELFFGGH